MAMSSWRSLRIGLLAVIFGGILCVLGKSILYPTVSHRPVSPFVFPTDVQLPEWQQVESAAVKMTEGTNFSSGMDYRYRQSRRVMDIQMRYVTNTNGDVDSFMGKHIAKKPNLGKLAIRQQKGVGFYGVEVHSKRAYLSACINPRGGSTVTIDQFTQNRNTYDVRFSRILPWVLGLGELRDWRCLWTVMSIPLEKASQEDAYKVLESAWFSWYQWWQPRFPNP